MPLVTGISLMAADMVSQSPRKNNCRSICILISLRNSSCFTNAMPEESRGCKYQQIPLISGRSVVLRIRLLENICILLYFSTLVLNVFVLRFLIRVQMYTPTLIFFTKCTSSPSLFHFLSLSPFFFSLSRFLSEIDNLSSTLNDVYIF